MDVVWKDLFPLYVPVLHFTPQALWKLSTAPDLRLSQKAAEHRDAPVDLLFYLAQDPDLLPAVLSNDLAPASLLEAHVDLSNTYHCYLLTEHPHAPPALLKQLILTGQDECTVRLALMSDRLIFAEVQHGLSDSRPWVREAVLERADCPAGVLEQHFNQPDMWWTIASHPNCPVHLLQHLSEEDHPGLRASVAHHPAATPMMLEKLARDPDSNVRCWTARNPNTPAHLLVLLCQDPDPETQALAAIHPNCPAGPKPEAFRRAIDHLCCSSCWGIVHDIWTDPVCPDGVLHTIARKMSSWEPFDPLCRAVFTPEVLQAFLDHPDPGLRQQAAKHPSMPRELLLQLEQGSEEPDLQFAVWQNPAWPFPLQDLMHHPDTRRALAGNPACPLALLEALAEDPDPEVLLQVALHPLLPLELHLQVTGRLVDLFLLT